jgi:hypothetical protein
MDGQGLSGSALSEVLGIRWAHDDQAGHATLQRKRDAEAALGAAVLASMESLPPEVGGRGSSGTAVF